MKRQCAWCKQYLGEVASGTADDRAITHGICDACRSNLAFQQGVDLSRFLNSLDVPLILRDAHDKVIFMNQAASTLLNTDRGVFPDGNLGLVFECQHARYAKACGRSIHCSGCAIRMAVQQTAATGRGVDRQPATLKQDDREVRLRITTEKVGNMILLRVDERTDIPVGR